MAVPLFFLPTPLPFSKILQRESSLKQQILLDVKITFCNKRHVTKKKLLVVV
jgi:hypothetical protein